MRLTPMLAALLLLLAACGAPAGSMALVNADPQAPRNLQEINIFPPEGWEPTRNAAGISDGRITVTALTLSELPVPIEDFLAQKVGETVTANDRNVLIERALNRRIAWTVIDGTLTSFSMQALGDVPLTEEEERLLIDLATTAQF
jgi:hypothetical protein